MLVIFCKNEKFFLVNSRTIDSINHDLNLSIALTTTQDTFYIRKWYSILEEVKVRRHLAFVFQFSFGFPLSFSFYGNSASIRKPFVGKRKMIFFWLKISNFHRKMYPFVDGAPRAIRQFDKIKITFSINVENVEINMNFWNFQTVASFES